MCASYPQRPEACTAQVLGVPAWWWPPSSRPRILASPKDRLIRTSPKQPGTKKCYLRVFETRGVVQNSRATTHPCHNVRRPCSECQQRGSSSATLTVRFPKGFCSANSRAKRAIAEATKGRIPKISKLGCTMLHQLSALSWQILKARILKIHPGLSAFCPQSWHALPVRLLT